MDARETAGVLSQPLIKVAYRVSWVDDMRASWASNPVCSRSLLVMVPLGLSKDTSREETSGEKGCLQRKLSPSELKNTPPMPILAASVAPRRVGS